MGLLDSLKSAIFEENGEVQEAKPAHSIQKTAQPIQSISITSDGKIKQKLADELLKNMVDSPYLQYQRMNNSMKVKIADIATRCTAMGIALEGQGITKSKILEGARNAIAFLENESKLFQTTVASSLDSLQQQLSNKSISIENSVEEKRKMITQLSDEISNLQKEKTEFEIKVSQDKGKLETSKVEFNASFNLITQEITKDISDITTYLGA